MTHTGDSQTVTLATPERSADTPLMGCRACGAMQPTGFRFCRVCGAPFTRGDLPRGFVDPLVGAVVGGRYRILARIGAGGMGAVYRVEHVQIGKIAAMKLLHGELSRDEAMVRRFNREARTVSRLASPHTVSVFDYGRSAGLVYIVMELLDGRDLSKVLADEGPLPAPRVANLIWQVAESLTEAHQLGIVHRDLKPQNLFLTEVTGGEQVKVLDFGLAKFAEVRDESMSLDESRAGAVMGTPHYMSPEQIRDESGVDARTDIYSLAAVTYRLLTGEPPFRHKTPLGVLHQHIHAAPPKLADTDPRLAPLDVVVQRGMAKDREDRYASVGEFAEALMAASERAESSGARRKVRLAPKPAAIDRARLGTRREFEEFERRLRLRRMFSGFATGLLALVGVVVAVVVGAAGAPVRTTESEPNDDPRTATRIAPSVDIRAAVGAGDGAANDTDVYVLERRDGARVLDVRVTPDPDVALNVDVLDATSRVVVSTTAPRGQALHLPNVGGPVGNAFVVVRGQTSGPSNGYTLTTTWRSAFDAEETEPNEAFPQVLEGVTTVGAIGWPEDVDRYWLEEGEWDITISGVPGVDIVAEISDRQRSAPIVLDGAGAGGGEAHRVTITPDRFVGAPVLAISAKDGASSHLVYRLGVAPRQ